MQVDALSAVVFVSPNPSALADFYRQHLGIPFRMESHGPMLHHLEAFLGDVHFAVLKGPARSPETGGPAPTFRVSDLDAFVESLRSAGIALRRKVMDLGDGKRLAQFLDPDGNTFSLIEISTSS